MIPEISGVFETIDSYRYSITVGILLLYFVPMFFPVGWNAVSATWQYAAAIMFFLAVGMILVRDVWPPVYRLFGGGFSRTEKDRMATAILRGAKKAADDENPEPPFKFSLEVLDSEDDIETYIAQDFAASECTVKDNHVVVTAEGLEALKSQI